MAFHGKSALGQILLQKKLITQEQLDLALKKQEETGKLLGVILLELGIINEETVLLPLVADQVGSRYIDLKTIEIAQETLKKLPSKFASHYKIIPLAYKDGTLTIATSDPMNIHLLDEVSVVSGCSIQTVLASEKEILEAIRKYYGVGAETIDKMMDSVQPMDARQQNVSHIDEIESEASIGKFLNQIFLEAYKDRATDIHIEPFEDALQIRYRVDGMLHDAKVPANLKFFKDAVCSRIKILSNLNIAEKRLPQDGRFKIKTSQEEIDFRVSFLPTPFGESVVLRILNATKLYSLKDLGLNPGGETIIAKLIKKPHGIIFLTGPTGSGKTTTLYSCLSNINTEEKKIITIEDPIEYQLKGVIQIQINPSIGLTFAHGLRSMLRHDPDVMMVGEVRDQETAEIATQIALTGHLVFSTLHTNDAASGVTRLLDMGVDPYLVTSTVECFIAQRLVRRLCPRCKKAVPLDMTQVNQKVFGDAVNLYKEFQNYEIFESTGCEACSFTGYRGREGIYEFLLINSQIKQLIMERANASIIKQKAVANGMRTLSMEGFQKILEGVTTFAEVIRVVQAED